MRGLRHLIYLSLILVVVQASAQVVEIPDPNLKRAVREALELPDEKPITQQEMRRLINLPAEKREITDLTGLEYATNLKELGLSFNQIQDITPLAGLVNLELLALIHNPISDLSPLANLIQLESLYLAAVRITDLTLLSNLTQLRVLDLQHCRQIRDITPLSNLTQLNRLEISHNQIVDVSPLANLTLLEVLQIDNNQVVDVTPLANLTQLTNLTLANNPITDFRPLFGLSLQSVDVDIHKSQELASADVEIPDPNLESAIRETLALTDGTPITRQELLNLMRLRVESPQLSNLTGLEHATNLENLSLGGTGMVSDLTPISNLTSLKTLNAGSNQISDIRPLANLTNLAGLSLWSNEIQDISPLANLTKLTYLNAGGNHIENLEPLTGLIRLRTLGLSGNRVIADIAPLANLTALETLRLDKNVITDIAPLVGLTNLKELRIADNPIYDFGPLLQLEEVELDTAIDEKLNRVVEVPDPNLEQAIRDALFLPDGVPLTQFQMQQLMRLRVESPDLRDLTGLEYAINLEDLSLGTVGMVSDLTPLANLTSLRNLNVARNQISDIRPLAGLIGLTRLNLRNNHIRDLNPLAGLIELTFLSVRDNRISDFSPLANLVNLEKLRINDNFGVDISPLQNLNLTDFRYDQICDTEPLLPPVRERIETRSFPSVHQAWDHVVGLDHLTSDQRYALHDLHWSPFFGLGGWQKTATEPTYGLATSLSGNLARAREIRQRRLDHNPNMVFLVETRIHNHLRSEAFPPDSDFWLRDAQGNIVKNAFNEHLINFLKPEVQDLIVKRIVAVARCGLYDGVMMNGFFLNGAGFLGRHLYAATDEEIITATENILRAVRSQVRDDFLILINTHRTQATRYTEYVNGSFIDVLREYDGGYTHHGLASIESTLLWSEENLRLPHINCVEGWGMTIEPPDGINNRRWMRVFTTMSLTHSDGYVLYNFNGNIFSDPHHRHLWYPFWDANLGQPVGPKAQQYKNIEGLFIREFTNGWAVYNRSGNAQTITLPASATRVSDRETNPAAVTHILPDLDGEIYLTTKSPADANSDGR